jgi:sugar lactone lactonase YvrE
MKKLLLSIFAIAAITAALFLFTGCGKGGNTPAPEVTTLRIQSINITHGPYGTSVAITGTGFKTAITDNQVFFNGKAGNVTAASATQLVAAVPVGAGTGAVTVSVSGSGAAVTGPVFTYEYIAMVSTLKTADGNPANFTPGVWGIALDATGNIFVSNIGGYIRQLTPAGVLSVFAGHGTIGGDGQGTAAGFNYAAGMKFDKTGNLYVADGNAIRKISATGAVTTFYANATANFTDLAFDAAGNIYATDFDNNKLIKINPAGVVASVIGTGRAGSQIGSAVVAEFNHPVGITMNTDGNFYVVDSGSNMIRMVTPAGVVGAFAGNGVRGLVNGHGSGAGFNNPTGIAADSEGNLYIGDFDNHVVRKITPDRMVSTYAGTGIGGSVDGPAWGATFEVPQCIAVDASNNVYVADGAGHVRKIFLQ